MMMRDRVKELRRVPASELRANPKNWRRHPPAQEAALRGVLEDIGFADAMIARETEDGLELIDGPGIKQPDGRYYFSPAAVLELNFTNASRLDATPKPNINSFTRIGLEGTKYVLSTTFVPNQPSPEVVEIRFAASLAHLDTSLRRSFVWHPSRQNIALALPRDWMSPC